MAEERFFVDSVVRGFHIYKDVWVGLGDTLLYQQEFGNIQDPFAVTVARHEDDTVVGHVPRRISSLCYFFLRRNVLLFYNSMK